MFNHFAMFNHNGLIRDHGGLLGNDCLRLTQCQSCQKCKAANDCLFHSLISLSVFSFAATIPLEFERLCVRRGNDPARTVSLHSNERVVTKRFCSRTGDLLAATPAKWLVNGVANEGDESVLRPNHVAPGDGRIRTPGLFPALASRRPHGALLKVRWRLLA
jgi:hypothetical protein